VLKAQLQAYIESVDLPLAECRQLAVAEDVTRLNPARFEFAYREIGEALATVARGLNVERPSCEPNA